MSVTWFELPPPADLGDGWSLRFLTAAQMLECRGEGEAKATEVRDKALWAGAALLSRVLLKEGEPAFPSGEAVLEHLTVGQIESLTRRWWVQDDFSGQVTQAGWPAPEGGPAQEGGPGHEAWPLWAGTPDREEGILPVRRAGQERGTVQKTWTNREQGENETFDMARFLELGGSSPEVVGAEVPAVAPSDLTRVWPKTLSQMWPQVWPGRAPAPGEVGTIPRPHGAVYEDGGRVMPARAMALPADIPLSPPGQADQGVALPQGEHPVVRVLLPETAPAEGGLTVEELDRVVERDARRYDGGSSLY